jgi:hypothetical protein
MTMALFKLQIVVAVEIVVIAVAAVVVTHNVTIVM